MTLLYSYSFNYIGILIGVTVKGLTHHTMGSYTIMIMIFVQIKMGRTSLKQGKLNTRNALSLLTLMIPPR